MSSEANSQLTKSCCDRVPSLTSEGYLLGIHIVFDLPDVTSSGLLHTLNFALIDVPSKDERLHRVLVIGKYWVLNQGQDKLISQTTTYQCTSSLRIRRSEHVHRPCRACRDQTTRSI